MKRHEKSHLYIDKISKSVFSWHEKDWIHAEDFHSHTKAQLVFVDEGFQYLHTEHSRFLLPQNHAAWIPSGLSHRTSSTVPTVSLRTLYFDTGQLPPFYECLHFFSVPDVLKKMILYTEKWSQKSAFILSEDYFLKAILFELPSFIEESVPLQIPIPQTPKLKSVVEFLNSQYHNDIKIADVATEFHLGLRTLERHFKKETGISIAKYLQLVRIVKAVELLNQAQYTVSEIAYLTGYKSIQSFSNSFYQLLGKRPQFYRTIE